MHIFMMKALSVLKTGLFFLSLFFLSQGVSAQVKLTGTVVDEANEAVIGANVLVKGTQNATMTDVNGKFTLDVPSGSTLVVSFMGYLSQEVAINQQTQVTITLKEDRQALEEVVVVGYGTQKKGNLTGSVAVIETADLATRPFASTSSALQGVAAGVTVTNSSGAPGSQGTIRVRGIGTLNNSNPLILIDGVEGDMNSIDPSMIASINVLKDAASSSIYGSRAANGVILVTTKRATSGGIKVDYNTYFGVQSPTDLPQKVGAIDHMRMINLAHVNSGASPLFTDAYINDYQANMAGNPDKYPNTDWQKLILTGSGFMQNHNVSINSGTEKIKLLTSAGFLDQKGIIETSGFKRYTFRNNADIQLHKHLSLKADVQFVKGVSTQPGPGATSVFLQMNRIPAIQPGLYSNGLYGEAWNGENPIAFSSSAGGSQVEEVMKLSGRFVLNYTPNDWMSAEVLVQPRFEEVYNDNYNKSITTYQADGTPVFTRPERTTLAMRSQRSMYNNYYGYLNLYKSVGKHNLKGLLGASLETYDLRSFRAYREGFLFPDYRVLDAGLQDNREATGTASEWALQSFFGRLNYDYNSKYLLEVNARYDGSSRFAAGHKYGFFPSVSAGWRLSSEDFLSTVPAITNLMLRASWGTLGNQNIGTYPFASTLNLGSYTMGSSIVPVAGLDEMSNQLISWETSRMTNLGVDLTLFSAWGLNVDWYDKITDDILLRLDIPGSIGLSAPYQNAGKVRNRGWDASLSYKNSNRKFKYGITFNLSDVKNTVLDLRGVSQSGLLVSREGYPINSILALQSDGYFQSQEEINKHPQQVGVLAPGDIRYVNQNSDNIINAEDQVIVGSTIPRYTYGLNLNAEYSGFTFNAFLQGVGKADGYLYGRAIQPFFSGASAYEVHKDYWTPENPNAQFPRLTWGDAGNNYQQSSFWMKDASYLRLKNVQVGYNLPKSVIKSLKISQARIYINGQNLFTIDKFWDGFDVETPVGTGTNYPMVKTYSIGLDLKF
jgi:TonB-linked SusC/RagA family outer membrane protein